MNRAGRRGFFNLASQDKIICKRRGEFVPIVPGVVSPMRLVPPHIKTPEYYLSGTPHQAPRHISLFHGKELGFMRISASLARRMLDYACSLVQEGITTEEIDRLTHEEIVRNDAYPSPINYAGFPKAICTSVNEVCCHGIPDNRPLQLGDIISIDVSVYKNGFHGDNCSTVIVGGQTNGRGEILVKATEEALTKAISMCGPGVCLTSVGEAIEQVASFHDFQISREFMGHGVGHILHMSPLVAHYRNSVKVPLERGMIFTIEPILLEGSRKLHRWSDGWSAVASDGGRSAQFEHEILITDNGAEVLTIA